MRKCDIARQVEYKPGKPEEYRKFGLSDQDAGELACLQDKLAKGEKLNEEEQTRYDELSYKLFDLTGGAEREN